jgi:hypothetical protein
MMFHENGEACRCKPNFWEEKRCTNAKLIRVIILLLVLHSTTYLTAQSAVTAKKKFSVMEATIADIQDAIKSRQITSTDLVKLYLTRIKAYTGDRFLCHHSARQSAPHRC